MVPRTRLTTRNNVLSGAKIILNRINPQSHEVTQQVRTALEALYREIHGCRDPRNRTPGNVIQFLLQQLAKEAEREHHSGDPELLEQLCFLAQHCQADITQPHHIALTLHALGKLANPPWLHNACERRLPYLEATTIINWLQHLCAMTPLLAARSAQAKKAKLVVTAQHVSHDRLIGIGPTFSCLATLCRAGYIHEVPATLLNALLQQLPANSQISATYSLINMLTTAGSGIIRAAKPIIEPYTPPPIESYRRIN